MRPGDQVAVASSLGWMLMVPQAFEVSWTELKHFNAGPAAAARRHDRGRGGVADRAASPGGLAGRPGGLADRRLRPERRLGRLAQGLTGPTAPGGAP